MAAVRNQMAAFVNLTFEGQTEQPLADYFLGPKVLEPHGFTLRFGR